MAINTFPGPHPLKQHQGLEYAWLSHGLVPLKRQAFGAPQWVKDSTMEPRSQKGMFTTRGSQGVALRK